MNMINQIKQWNCIFKRGTLTSLKNRQRRGHMLKRKIFSQITGMIVLGAIVVSGFVQTVNATSTADKLNQVEQQKKANQNKLDKTSDSIQELKGERASLQSYLTNLSDQLERTTEELNRLEGLISEKEASIAKTEVELEEARKNEKIQYEAMRQRIRFMYERSHNLYLDILFSSDSFVSFLNHTEYIEKMTEYDRDMLENYQQLQITIKEDEEMLQEEKAGLVALIEQSGGVQDEMIALVNETHSKVQAYKSEIDAKEKEALKLEEEIRKQESERADLQEQLQKEIEISRKAATSVIRDFSDLSLNSTDLDMMAAIIECEAGGESYTGKVAVGAVVMNRVRSSLFPDTVAGVIYQKRQFSPVGSGRFAIVLARGANASCYEAAQEAMAGSSPVGNCLFFRTPIPGLTGIQIGGHIFY